MRKTCILLTTAIVTAMWLFPPVSHAIFPGGFAYSNPEVLPASGNAALAEQIRKTNRDLFLGKPVEMDVSCGLARRRAQRNNCGSGCSVPQQRQQQRSIPAPQSPDAVPAPAPDEQARRQAVPPPTQFAAGDRPVPKRTASIASLAFGDAAIAKRVQRATVRIANFESEEEAPITSGQVVGVHKGIDGKTRGYVLTCYHGFIKKGRIIATFADGYVRRGAVVDTDVKNDLALLMFYVRDDLPTVPIADAKSWVSNTNGYTRGTSQLIHVGYGEDGKFYTGRGAFQGYVTASHNGDLSKKVPAAESDKYNTGRTQIAMVGQSQPGDSGGGIYSKDGKLQGVVWGAPGGQVFGTYAGKVRQFLETTQVRWQRDPSRDRYSESATTQGGPFVKAPAIQDPPTSRLAEGGYGEGFVDEPPVMEPAKVPAQFADAQDTKPPTELARAGRLLGGHCASSCRDPNCPLCNNSTSSQDPVPPAPPSTRPPTRPPSNGGGDDHDQIQARLAQLAGMVDEVNQKLDALGGAAQQHSDELAAVHRGVVENAPIDYGPEFAALTKKLSELPGATDYTDQLARIEQGFEGLPSKMDQEPLAQALTALLAQVGAVKEDTGQTVNNTTMIIEKQTASATQMTALKAALDDVTARPPEATEPAEVTIKVESDRFISPKYVDVSVLWALQQASGVDHMVLITDTNTEHWQRMQGEFESAREEFPLIDLFDVAANGVTIKSLPQLVIYSTAEGSDPEILHGTDAVSKKLQQIARSAF